MPASLTVRSVLDDLGLTYEDERLVSSLQDADIRGLRRKYKPVSPHKLGFIGDGLSWNGSPYTGYAIVPDTVRTNSGAEIPYVVEAWALCNRVNGQGAGEMGVSLVINKSTDLGQISGWSDSSIITIKGCGLRRSVRGHKGFYDVLLSVISPYVEITNDGKSPNLLMFGEAIATVLKKACGQAAQSNGKTRREHHHEGSRLQRDGQILHVGERRRPILRCSPPGYVRRTGRRVTDMRLKRATQGF